MEDIDEYPYVVCEFYEGVVAQVEAVPSNWLSNVETATVRGVALARGTCLWPTNKNKVEAFIRNRKEPNVQDTKSWSSYPINVRRWCKTLKEAKHKADQCQYTSDLESDSNKKNRHVRAKKADLFRSESEDSDGDDDLPPIGPMLLASGLKSSQTIGDAKLRNSLPVQTTSSAPSNGIAFPLGNMAPPAVKETGSILPPVKETGCISPPAKETISTTPDPNSKELLVNTTTPIHKITTPTALSCLGSGRDTANDGAACSGSGGFTSPSVDPTSGNKSSIKQSSPVKRKLSYTPNNTRVSYNSPQKRSPFKRGISPAAAVAPPLERPAGSPDIPSLPLCDHDAMKAWHTWLMDESNFSSAVNLLVTHGGSALKDSTYNMLRSVLADELAVKYNSKGTNKKDVPKEQRKVGLGDTLTYKAIQVALAKYRKNYNEQAANIRPKIFYVKDLVEEFTGRWLKDANKRLQNKLKRQEKSAAQDNSE